MCVRNKSNGISRSVPFCTAVASTRLCSFWLCSHGVDPWWPIWIMGSCTANEDLLKPKCARTHTWMQRIEFRVQRIYHVLRVYDANLWLQCTKQWIYGFHANFAVFIELPRLMWQLLGEHRTMEPHPVAEMRKTRNALSTDTIPISRFRHGNPTFVYCWTRTRPHAIE